MWAPIRRTSPLAENSSPQIRLPSTVSPSALRGDPPGLENWPRGTVEIAADVSAAATSTPSVTLKPSSSRRPPRAMSCHARNGRDMRPTEAHGQRRCLVEVDRASEGTIEEGERAP